MTFCEAVAWVRFNWWVQGCLQELRGRGNGANQNNQA